MYLRKLPEKGGGLRSSGTKPFSFSLILCIFLLIIFSCVSAFSEDSKYIVLDVDGEGSTRNEAIESAWLSGIHQAVGSFIDAKTELNNDQLIERIIAYSRGLVERYEVTGVDDSRAREGIYKVKTRLWIVQDLLRDGAEHASSGSAEIAFSPEDITRRREELDAKALEARNAAQETSQQKSQTGAELLSAMLGRYKPEDFLTCYIPGKPEPVKDKADTFTLNIEVSFNETLYKEKFIPDLIQVLDQIAAVKKNMMLTKSKTQLRDIAAKKGTNRENSIIFEAFGTEKDYTLAVYNRPERFGVRLYGFRSEDEAKINSVLSDFMKRALRVRGITLELIDEDKETIETVEQTVGMKFLLSSSAGKWAVHPTIISYASKPKESINITVPVTLDMPEEVLPFVKNLKASLIIRESKPGRLGFSLMANMSIAKVSAEAFNAGLRNGDVLKTLNGQTVKVPGDINRILKGMYEGEIVSVGVARYNQVLAPINVTLAGQE